MMYVMVGRQHGTGASHLSTGLIDKVESIKVEMAKAYKSLDKVHEKIGGFAHTLRYLQMAWLTDCSKTNGRPRSPLAPRFVKRGNNGVPVRYTYSASGINSKGKARKKSSSMQSNSSIKRSN